MSRADRKARRNADGISFSGNTRASGANDGKPCDKGGDRHVGPIDCIGTADKVQILKGGRVKVTQWNTMKCRKCGSTWDEPGKNK
jgi:hypothetical protein